MKRLILLIILVGVLAVAGLGFWTYSDLHKPIAHTKNGQYIDIPKGSSPSAIVRKLAVEGIIKHEWPLTLYLKATGKGSTLKAGEYDFPSPISPLAALAKLQTGERRLAAKQSEFLPRPDEDVLRQLVGVPAAGHATHEAVDLIPFGGEELGEIRSVLAGDPCHKRF